jgi:hypothetical protein
MLKVDLYQIDEASYPAEVTAASGGREGSSKARLHQMIILGPHISPITQARLHQMIIAFIDDCLFPSLMSRSYCR